MYICISLYLKNRKGMGKSIEKKREILSTPPARACSRPSQPTSVRPLPLSLSLWQPGPACQPLPFLPPRAYARARSSSPPCRSCRAASTRFPTKCGAYQDALPFPHDLAWSPYPFGVNFFPLFLSFMETIRSWSLRRFPSIWSLIRLGLSSISITRSLAFDSKH